MSSLSRIAVIGATGSLGKPVVQELVRAGFFVRAIARDPVKAQSLLVKEVEVIKGDLQDVDSLERAFYEMDAVYLNLTTPSRKAAFYPERDGTKNVIQAAQAADLQHISKISGLGTRKVNETKWWQHQQKFEAEQAIIESGIPYTIFQPTFFMETLLMLIRGKSLTLIGDPANPFYWIAGEDYGKQVVAALKSEQAHNKRYAIQGLEPLTMKEAALRFIQVYDPTLKVSSIPLALVKMLGLFSDQMQLVSEAIGVLSKTKDEFVSRETWNELGQPQMKIEDFAQVMRGSGAR
ncbi:SDR family oxidoreductase [Nostoc sp.]|uniref:SDR family oxidoreductase n=1 Tax=Nostoc sp. TaxID=1180 RepID=UPI002FFCB7E3